MCYCKGNILCCVKNELYSFELNCIVKEMNSIVFKLNCIF